jgi:hypothetical protein
MVWTRPNIKRNPLRRKQQAVQLQRNRAQTKEGRKSNENDTGNQQGTTNQKMGTTNQGTETHPAPKATETGKDLVPKEELGRGKRIKTKISKQMENEAN